MGSSFSETLSLFFLEDGNLSAETKAQIRLHRLLTFLGAVLVPLFGPLRALSNPGAVDPMWARLGIAGLLAGLLGASYVSEWIRRNYVVWLRGLLYVLMGWFVIVAALNRFAGSYASGVLLVFMVLTLVVGLGARSMGPVLRFSGFGLLLMVGAVVLGPAPRNESLVLLGSMAAAALLEGVVIQAHVSTREELREREERVRGLANSIPGVVIQFYARPDGTFGLHFVSEHAEELLGISADPEGFYERCVECVPASHREELVASIDEAVEEGRPWRLETPFEKPDGERIWLLGTSTPVKQEEELVFNGVILDITERKRAEQVLHEERDRLETLFENLPTPVVRCTVEEGILIADVNKSFEEVFGVEASAVEGEDIDELLVPEDKREEAAEIARRALEENAQQAEVRRKAADGLRDFRLQVAGRTRDEGPPEVYVIYTDITEQKEREEQLERKNERLDSFASVVSHDLRNPLNVAKGRLGLASEDGDSSHLAAVDRALDRMDEIIRNVLTLTWGERELDPEALEPCRLNDVAERSWEQVDTAEARLCIEDDRVVRADQSRLRRLLGNLFRNTMEHGGTKGTVRIGTLPGGFFVEDDGPGIPPEEREEVFEAGYSSEDGGTGLGLSIVETIATAHGWSLSATDGPEGGARFEFIGIEGEE